MTKQIVQLILTMSVVAFPKLHFKWLEVHLMKFTFQRSRIPKTESGHLDIEYTKEHNVIVQFVMSCIFVN